MEPNDRIKSAVDSIIYRVWLESPTILDFLLDAESASPGEVLRLSRRIGCVEYQTQLFAVYDEWEARRRSIGVSEATLHHVGDVAAANAAKRRGKRQALKVLELALTEWVGGETHASE